ncbi:hypothetical protein ACFLU6_10010 [Acidobacteriota bacterium]
MKTRILYYLCIAACVSLLHTWSAEGQWRETAQLLNQVYGDNIPEILDLQFATDQHGVLVAVWCENDSIPQIFYSERHQGLWSEPHRLSDPGVASFNFSMVVPSFDQRQASRFQEPRGSLFPVATDSAQGDRQGAPGMYRAGSPSKNGRLDLPPGPYKNRGVVVAFETHRHKNRRQIKFPLRADHDPLRQGWNTAQGGEIEIDTATSVNPTLHELEGHVWLTFNHTEEQAIGYAFLEEHWIGPFSHGYNCVEEIPDIMRLIQEAALTHSNE